MNHPEPSLPYPLHEEDANRLSSLGLGIYVNFPDRSWEFIHLLGKEDEVRRKLQEWEAEYEERLPADE